MHLSRYSNRKQHLRPLVYQVGMLLRHEMVAVEDWDDCCSGMQLKSGMGVVEELEIAVGERGECVLNIWSDIRK